MINKNNISWFSPEMTGKEIQNIEKVLDSNFINAVNEVVGEVTSPLTGVFSTYGLIKAISD